MNLNLNLNFDKRALQVDLLNFVTELAYVPSTEAIVKVQRACNSDTRQIKMC